MGPSAGKEYPELVRTYVKENAEEAEVMGAGVSLDVFTRSMNSLLELSKEVVGSCKRGLQTLHSRPGKVVHQEPL